MKITNNLDLPQPFVRAVEEENYNKGKSGFSVTELISPVQVRYLEKKHWDEIEVDASDLVRSLSGQLFHTLMERAGTGENEIVEKRFFHEFMGETISGQADLLDTDQGILYDYKEVSPRAVSNGIKPEWEQQLNLLDYLAYQNGFKVRELAIMAKFDGWSQAEAFRNPSYPQRRVGVFSINKWSRGDQVEFLRNRLLQHRAARDFGNPRDCTPEEKWEKESKWALMKSGRKSAVRLFPTYEDLELYCSQHDIKFSGNTEVKKGDYYVEYRKGEAIRCKYYCPVGRETGICQQWEREKETEGQR